MKRLDETVLPGAARIYIDCLDVFIGQPLLHLMSNELTAFVTMDLAGSSLFFNDLAENSEDVLSGHAHATRDWILLNPIGEKHLRRIHGNGY